MGRPRGSKNKPAGDNGDGEPLRNTVSGDEVRKYIERVENVNAEIKELSDDRREIFAEFKAAGYDVKTLRTIIKRRATDPDVLATADALLDMYMAALGDYASTPLGQAAADRVRASVE